MQSFVLIFLVISSVVGCPEKCACTTDGFDLGGECEGEADVSTLDFVIYESCPAAATDFDDKLAKISLPSGCCCDEFDLPDKTTCADKCSSCPAPDSTVMLDMILPLGCCCEDFPKLIDCRDACSTKDPVKNSLGPGMIVFIVFLFLFFFCAVGFGVYRYKKRNNASSDDLIDLLA